MRVREYLAWWLVILGWLVAGLEAQSAGHWKWLAAQRAMEVDAWHIRYAVALEHLDDCVQAYNSVFKTHKELEP